MGEEETASVSSSSPTASSYLGSNQALRVAIPVRGVSPGEWAKPDVRSPQWARFLAKPGSPSAQQCCKPKFAYESSASTATRAALVPSGLVDDAVVVGAEGFNVSEAELESGGRVIEREAVVLERLPARSSEGRGRLTDGSLLSSSSDPRSPRDKGGVEARRPEPPSRIEWFCFPSSTVECAWRRTRPRSRLHVFALFADGLPLRGVVLTFYAAADRVVSADVACPTSHSRLQPGRAPVQHASGSRATHQHTNTNTLVPGASTAVVVPAPPMGKKKRHPMTKRLWVPTAVCLLSRLAVVPALEAWLEQLGRIVDACGGKPGAASARLLAAAMQLADEVPRPVAGVLNLKVAGPLREVVRVREHFAASRGNQLRRRSADRFFATHLARPSGGGGSLWLCALLLGPHALCAALAAVCLERPVLLLAQAVAALAPVAEALLALVRPLEWSHVYVPVLPKPLLELLDAPQPYILGVQSDWLPDNFAGQSRSARRVHDSEYLSEGGGVPRRRGDNLSRAKTANDALLSPGSPKPRPSRPLSERSVSVQQQRRREPGEEDSHKDSTGSAPNNNPTTKRPGFARAKSSTEIVARRLRLFPPRPPRSATKALLSYRTTRARADNSANSLTGGENEHATPVKKFDPAMFASPPSSKSASSFWARTPVAPGAVALDLDTGAFFAPPGTGDDPLPTLPDEFAADVADATKRLLEAADAVLLEDRKTCARRKTPFLRADSAGNSGSRAKSDSSRATAVADAERELQRVCARHLERLIGGAGAFVAKSRRRDGGALLDAEALVASHPGPVRPFLRRLVETQHFWQFVDAHIGRDDDDDDDDATRADGHADGRAAPSRLASVDESREEDKLVYTPPRPGDAAIHSPADSDDGSISAAETNDATPDERPADCLAEHGFRFLRGAAHCEEATGPDYKKHDDDDDDARKKKTFADGRRSDDVRPHDPPDAYCYVVPPPLPQDAKGPSRRRRSSYSAVPYEDRSYQATHEWKPEPVFAADGAVANATRVYRYGTLADLLGLSFEDLWAQLEGDTARAPTGSAASPSATGPPPTRVPPRRRSTAVRATTI